MAIVEGITVEKKKQLGSMGESNEAGDNCLPFAMSHNMRVVNTYFEKAERHNITYKNRAAESQIDYILCRSSDTFFKYFYGHFLV